LRQTKEGDTAGACYACGRITNGRCTTCGALLCGRDDCPKHHCDWSGELPLVTCAWCGKEGLSAGGMHVCTARPGIPQRC
jgi:hypothetical protein